VASIQCANRAVRFIVGGNVIEAEYGDQVDKVKTVTEERW
jgi:hypothetical protein